MAKSLTVTIGHSPDPDDAFMFHGIRCGAVGVSGVRFRHVLRDIQTLNEWAERGKLAVSAISLHGYARVSDRYLLLPHGASVGDGYGPIVVAKKLPRGHSLSGVTVAVPGLRTTACLVLRLAHPRARIVVMPFDRILDAVAKGKVAAGVIIHEGQLTYRDAGVRLVTDLGAWWKRTTKTPLVLGVNVIRRDLPARLLPQVTKALGRSIRYGLRHRSDALGYAMKFGRGISRSVADRFVGMYVNRDTLSYRPAARRGMRLLLDRAWKAGLLPFRAKIEFAK